MVTISQDREGASENLGLPSNAFTRFDAAPDTEFYQQPRLVMHIEDAAIAAVTDLYREFLPARGEILDLMSSWVSHLPPETNYRNVAGLGMNLQELEANARLTQKVVQDLNLNPVLPWADKCFDAACICVSVQYLQRPIEVFAEVARLLRPAAPFIVTFSNRCFPTKAVAIWRALQGTQHQQLVAAYMQAAKFVKLEARSFIPGNGDPLWAVIGQTPG